MKKTDKAELIEAARVATASMENDEHASFWEELGDRMAAREKGRPEIKPRPERD